MSSPWWVAALLFVAAVSSTKEAVEAIASGSEDAPEAVVYLRDRGRPGLWAAHAAAKRERGERRVRLLAALGELPFEGAEWALREAYRKGDPVSRLGAVRGLGRLGGPGARRVLLEAVRDEDDAIRVAAARGLGVEVEPVRTEVSAMLYESDPRMVLSALEVAKTSEDPALTRLALPVGLDHPDPEVRRAALELMQATGSPEGIEAARRLARSPDPEAGRAAVQALAATAAPERFRWLGTILADPDIPEPTRNAAFAALVQADAAGFSGLVEGLSRAPDAELRLRRGLPRPVPPEHVERWIDALGRADPRWQRTAETALEVIGSPAHRPLIAALADSDPRVAERALVFLLRAAGEGLDDELERASRADDPGLRAGAVTARIRRSSAAEVARFVEALDDDSPRVRAAAARALAAVGHPAADAVVIERAGTDPVLDEAFLEGIAERPRSPLRRDLALRMLESPSSDVRRKALEVLTPAPDPGSLAALVDHLPGAPLDEKQQALEAIASSSVPEAAGLMVDLVTHVDPQIREAALRYVSER